MQEGLLYSVFQAEETVSRDTPLGGEAVLQAMIKYMAQSGAYVTGQAPYIESRYGCGEVAQAFIRHACVYGGAVALGTPVSDIFVREGTVHGVKTVSGQVIRCSALFASPAYLSGFAMPAPDPVRDGGEPHAGGPTAEHRSEKQSAEADEARRRGKAMARGIVVLREPVLPHLTNCQVVFPPGACGNEHTVTVWHCLHTLGICPTPGALLHLSMPRAAGDEALQALRACVAELLKVPDDSGGKPRRLEEGRGPDAAAGWSGGDENPILVECYYLQDLSGGDAVNLCKGAICCQPVGRGWTLDSSLLLAERLFKEVYPDEVFLTKIPPATALPVPDEDVDPLDAALKDLGLE